MNRRLAVFLLTVVALVAGVNIVCLAQSQTLLTRHVREVTLNGQAPLVGRLPVTQSMQIDVVLALRHQPELENFLQELYDPSSPSYRHFVTVPEFTARFGPSQEDYDALIGFAKANGFTVLGGSRDAMDVQLKGSVATIEKAFHVTMGVYQHPTENRTFYAPDREPTVDLPFQLWHISGLDNYSIPHPLFVKRDSQSQVRPQPEAVTGSCPGKSFCGSDMRAAYYEGTALTGSGQNIGLLEYYGFDIADVNTYYKNAGQTRNFAVTGISTDGSSINCTEPSCDDTEQTIDITQAGGMAPDVTTVYVYVGSTDTAVLGGMSSDTPLPLNLSSSWTWSPPDPGTDDPYFMKMATQGQSFFQASGDGGGYEGDALWPANSAYVIAVGGTDLTTTGPAGPWASETAWSDGGGGYGSNVDIPSWQTAAVAKCTGCSQKYRDVPDVAANANFTFYVCADQKACTENEYGGTSFAAPMWAGYLALANQQAAANGVPAPGFIDPTIYVLNLANGDADFHDITSGSNGFTCSSGYNLCDGWGSPNGAALINALTAPAGPNFTLSANPNSVTITQGGSGTSTITITPEDGFTGNVSLSASGLPTGVTAGFSPNPATTTSTLTLTASASAATGTVTVTITGTSGSLTNSTTLSLTVNASGSGAAVTLSPTSLTWGGVVLGSTGAKKTVTLTNSGTATLNISSIVASGDFALVTSSKPCGSTLVAGANCKISATFTPTQLGERTGNITITDNAPNSPQMVPLSGTGKAQATLTPTSATYASQTVGTTSPAKTFTLKNNQSVSLTSIVISTTGDFHVSTTTCGSSLGATSSCTIGVTFTPTQTGTRTGTLQASDSANNSPQISNLKGTGK
ncbi:MAG: choice-of-anchor D domain-containing protein [Terriglobales bacterium]